ncbi:MAG TPA: hypothetical protein PKG60_00035 [Spirochaetota bacterium]|nr:hypothetical protein [Spirochaetota bacterium]HPS88276.1 hypothetical protein [Spirochaetota bacterium]
MLKKILSLIYLLLVSFFIISCVTEQIKKYDGPHSLSEAGNSSKTNYVSSSEETGGSAVAQGVVVGSISSVNYSKNEVVVHQKKVVDLGTVVYVIIDNKEILMTVSFPMMSSFKCLVVPNQMQYIKSMKKGMTVYIKQ